MTNKTREPIKYDLDQFDQYTCLKPNAPLIASILFLCRDFAMPILAAVSKFSGSSTDMSGALARLQSGLLLSGMPALLIAYALLNRTPTAGAATRWIFARGRILLSASVALQLFPIMQQFLENPRMNIDNFVAFVTALIAVKILIYLWTSRRVKDLFAQFPAAAEKQIAPEAR